MQVPIMNFLPASAEIGRDYRITKKRLNKLLIWIAIVVISAVFAEAIIIVYNHISMKSLQVENSKQLLEKNEEMKKMIDLAIIAKNERLEMVHMVDLLAVKPRNMKLTRIDVDKTNIVVEGFAVDSNLFNEYTESKKAEAFFNEMKIDKIAAVGNKSPYKTCTIRASVRAGHE